MEKMTLTSIRALFPDVFRSDFHVTAVRFLVWLVSVILIKQFFWVPKTSEAPQTGRTTNKGVSLFHPPSVLAHGIRMYNCHALCFSTRLAPTSSNPRHVVLLRVLYYIPWDKSFPPYRKTGSSKTYSQNCWKWSSKQHRNCKNRRTCCWVKSICRSVQLEDSGF